MRKRRMNGNQNQNSDKTLSVQKGIKSSHDGRKQFTKRKFTKKQAPIDISNMAAKITGGSRRDLARGITLIESKHDVHQQQAQQLLELTMSEETNSVRIGISGVPGAGKSTFIDSFGTMLCDNGYKVAVLAIDPSSTVTGGSVLGDKTRMERLSNHPNAFIRPSPTSGTLGGVHRKTRETMQLCEAAGYDIILVETVGVGQSEVAVRNMVDFFMLLVLTGAGDELQGMKKGIMEITDLIIVHKADGENERQAKRTVREYKRILHHLQPATPNWEATALPVSSVKLTGHKDVWEYALKFQEKMQKTGYWEKRRKEQIRSWFTDMLYDAVMEQFFNESGKKEQVRKVEEAIFRGELTVRHAVEQVLARKG